MGLHLQNGCAWCKSLMGLVGMVQNVNNNTRKTDTHQNPMENVWAYIRPTNSPSNEEILDKCTQAWNFFADDAE